MIQLLSRVDLLQFVAESTGPEHLNGEGMNEDVYVLRGHCRATPPQQGAAAHTMSTVHGQKGKAGAGTQGARENEGL
jgi:hypothetical protein